MNAYPRWFFPTMMSIFSVLLVSGLLLVPDMLEMRLEWDTPIRLNGSLRLDSAALHSLAGFLTLGVLGALSTLHARLGWQRGRSRVSGSIVIALLLALVVSAVGIYYLGDPDWSRDASLIHTLLGLAATAVFGWHYVNGRRIRQGRCPIGWRWRARKDAAPATRTSSARGPSARPAWPSSERRRA